MEMVPRWPLVSASPDPFMNRIYGQHSMMIQVALKGEKALDREFKNLIPLLAHNSLCGLEQVTLPLWIMFFYQWNEIALDDFNILPSPNKMIPKYC
jgi:hypothetical protein